MAHRMLQCHCVMFDVLPIETLASVTGGMSDAKFMTLQMGLQSSLNQLTLASNAKAAQMQQMTALIGMMMGASPATMLAAMAAPAAAAAAPAAAPAIAGLATAQPTTTPATTTAPTTTA